MFELIQRIPEPWRQLTDVLIAPLAWIPRMQHAMWDFFVAPGPWWLVAGKCIFPTTPVAIRICIRSHFRAMATVLWRSAC